MGCIDSSKRSQFLKIYFYQIDSYIFSYRPFDALSKEIIRQLRKQNAVWMRKCRMKLDYHTLMFFFVLTGLRVLLRNKLNMLGNYFYNALATTRLPSNSFQFILLILIFISFIFRSLSIMDFSV